jgi:hypothetical protein
MYDIPRGHRKVEAGQLWRHQITGEPFVPEQKLVNQDQWQDAQGYRRWEDELVEEYDLVESHDERIQDWWDGLTDEQRAEALKITGTTGPPWLGETLRDATVFAVDGALGDGPWQTYVPQPVLRFLEQQRDESG